MSDSMNYPGDNIVVKSTLNWLKEKTFDELVDLFEGTFVTPTKVENIKPMSIRPSDNAAFARKLEKVEKINDVAFLKLEVKEEGTLARYLTLDEVTQVVETMYKA